VAVYLDHHAASPLAAGVEAAMQEARAAGWANPSSTHAAGRAARAVAERARSELAATLGAKPAELVLTAGGTEACNLGVLGLGGSRVLTTRLEHPAVHASIAALDAEVVLLETPGGEAPDILPLDGVSLACIQWVNHETGTILPVAKYAAQCRAADVPLFIDACQALGKVPVDLGRLGASAVALASSKIGGPAGAGALWIARDTQIEPRALGGGQEHGRRAGTPDVVALAGFAFAASLVGERVSRQPGIAELRDRLEAELLSFGVVNGADAPRVGTVSNVSVRGWKGPRLVAALDLEGLMASHGAACSSGLGEPSEVIMAVAGGEAWRAEAALRLSLGPSTTGADIDRALVVLRRVLGRKSPSSKF